MCKRALHEQTAGIINMTDTGNIQTSKTIDLNKPASTNNPLKLLSFTRKTKCENKNKNKR